MGISALSIKLRCASWEQLSGLYDREIKAGRLFLRSTAPPAIGTELAIDLTLPSGTVIPLVGRVARVITDGPRGTGVDLVLLKVPPSTLWLIESAITSAQRRTGSNTAISSGPAPVPAPAAAAPPPPPAPPPRKPTSAAFGDDTTFVGQDGDEEAGVDIEIAEEPETAAAEASLVAALEGELTVMRGLNPFQLLDVGYEASDQEVRNSFSELSKKTHPDRYAQYESERARALASEMFVLVREAYGKIGEKASRQATAAKLRPVTEAGKTLARVAVVSVAATRGAPPPIPPAPPPPPRKPLSADDLFGDLGEAPPAVTRGAMPVQLDGAAASSVSEGERLLLAGQHDQALELFESALRASPNERAARIGRELALGLRLVTAGDRAKATQHFETVLELDPLHELASRELAAIRRAFTESRKGVLNKLLGRKG